LLTALVNLKIFQLDMQLTAMAVRSTALKRSMIMLERAVEVYTEDKVGTHTNLIPSFIPNKI